MPSPSLLREQVRAVDRIAIEELGYPGVVLMENAARNAARAAEDLARVRGARGFAIFAGTGNNGGDGLVMARHLDHHGHNVRSYLVGDPGSLSPDAAVQYRILVAEQRAPQVLADEGAMRAAVAELGEGDLVVDALLGTGFQGEVREPVATLLRLLNDAPRAGVLAIDIPSGLDADSGRPSTTTLKADHTVTFVARKRGFDQPTSIPYTGEVEVAEIGAPPWLIDRVLEQYPG